jgi:hypothetical protein
MVPGAGGLSASGVETRARIYVSIPLGESSGGARSGGREKPVLNEHAPASLQPGGWMKKVRFESLTVFGFLSLSSPERRKA